MEVTVERLFQIIGQQHVELQLARAEMDRLRKSIEDGMKDKQSGVTPLRPPA